MGIDGIDRSVPPNVTPELLSSIPESIIREHLLYAARTTHAPPIYHIASILPSIAHMLSVAGYRVALDGLEEPPHLLVALIGGSGSAKSTAAKRARAVTRAAMRRSLEFDYIDPYLVADGSPQGVFHAMRDWHLEGLGITPAILWQDELTKMLRHETFADMLCQLYDGEKLQRHLRGHQSAVRKGEREKGDEDVESPVISGVFCSTPESLEETVRKSQLGGGLFGRILPFLEEVDVDHMMYEPPRLPQHEALVVEVLHKWFDYMLDQRQLLSAGEAGDAVLRLSPAANVHIRDTLWESVRHQLASRTRVGSVLTRMVHHCKLISMLYAASRCHYVAELQDAKAAVSLCVYSMRAAVKLNNTLAVSDEQRAIQRLEDAILRSKTQGINHSSLMRAVRAFSKVDRDRALWTLLEADEVFVLDISTGGRPAKRYYHKIFTREVLASVAKTASPS